jgi:hypothetical protein
MVQMREELRPNEWSCVGGSCKVSICKRTYQSPLELSRSLNDVDLDRAFVILCYHDLILQVADRRLKPASSCTIVDMS